MLEGVTTRTNQLNTYCCEKEVNSFKILSRIKRYIHLHSLLDWGKGLKAFAEKVQKTFQYWQYTLIFHTCFENLHQPNRSHRSRECPRPRQGRGWELVAWWRSVDFEWYLAQLFSISVSAEKLGKSPWNLRRFACTCCIVCLDGQLCIYLYL